MYQLIVYRDEDYDRNECTCGDFDFFIYESIDDVVNKLVNYIIPVVDIPGAFVKMYEFDIILLKDGVPILTDPLNANEPYYYKYKLNKNSHVYKRAHEIAEQKHAELMKKKKEEEYNARKQEILKQYNEHTQAMKWIKDSYPDFINEINEE